MRVKYNKYGYVFPPFCARLSECLLFRVERWSKSVLFQSFCSRQKSSLVKSFKSERKILAMRLPKRKEFWIKKISPQKYFSLKANDDDDDDDAVGAVRVTTWCNSAKRSTAAAPLFFFWKKKKKNIFSSSKEAYLLFDWSDDGDDGDIIIFFVEDRRRGVERGGHR